MLRTLWRRVLLLLAVLGGHHARAQPTDLQKWAAVLAQSMLSHTGSREGAHTQLQLFKELVSGKLSLAAEGKAWREFSSQEPAIHKLLGGALTVIDPALYTDTSAKIVNQWNGATLSSSFITYSPCLIFNYPYGFGLNAFGASIQPTGIFIVPTGFNVMPQGLNIAPTLIFIGPVGRNIQATGFNVVPALIAVAPVYEAQEVIGKDLSTVVLGTQVTLPREQP